MTTSKILVTVCVLTYQLWSQILIGECGFLYWLDTLQSQTHLVLDPLSTMENWNVPQMYMIHPQRSYCYFHQLLYHLCHQLLPMSADMLVFEMPDFLGENVHIKKKKCFPGQRWSLSTYWSLNDSCIELYGVVWSCIEYVCYTLHYREKLKQRVFLKNWLMVDITFWIAYRYTSPCQKGGKQKTPNCNNFDVGKKIMYRRSCKFLNKKKTPQLFLLHFFLLSRDSILKLQTI